MCGKHGTQLKDTIKQCQSAPRWKQCHWHEPCATAGIHRLELVFRGKFDKGLFGFFLLQMKNDSNYLSLHEQRYQNLRIGGLWCVRVGVGWGCGCGEEKTVQVFRSVLQFSFIGMHVFCVCISSVSRFSSSFGCLCMHVWVHVCAWFFGYLYKQDDTVLVHTPCIYVCVRALVRSGDVMLWPACCGTWPPLYCVSSTLWGSTIPQPPAHNTHYSIPQTTTEQNSTTPGTKSTQSLTTRRGKKNTWAKTNKTFQSQQPSQATN